MQLAGQICGHRPHATHFERPCSSVSMRWVPRQRDEIVQSSVDFSSGYCIVTFGRNRCRKVSAIPLRVARTYDVADPGRFISFTPTAIRPSPLPGQRGRPNGSRCEADERSEEHTSEL